MGLCKSGPWDPGFPPLGEWAQVTKSARSTLSPTIHFSFAYHVWYFTPLLIGAAYSRRAVWFQQSRAVEINSSMHEYELLNWRYREFNGSNKNLNVIQAVYTPENTGYGCGWTRKGTIYHCTNWKVY